MSEPFLSEIKIIAFNFAPKGWAFCNGQLLPISQNQALFSLLGTTYGGDGRLTFGLPNLQGRVPLHTGGGHTLGERAGEAAHTLSISELPAHGHALTADTASPSRADPSGGSLTASRYSQWSSAPPGATMAAPSSATGGTQPHQNMPPFLVLNFVIALQGIFPSQN